MGVLKHGANNMVFDDTKTQKITNILKEEYLDKKE